jgi:hypothetical protein
MPDKHRHIKNCTSVGIDHIDGHYEQHIGRGKKNSKIPLVISKG